MTSQYRHRRTSNPSTVFPTLEPGEIATNTSNRQLAVGDAASGTIGAPLALLAMRFFDSRAIYAAGDLVYQANVVYRAKAAAGPGAFNPSQWDALAGAVDPQYVLKAGDTMTGALNLPAASPTAGVHATNKTYVDNLVATKASIVSSISPPVGVPDNTLWFESDTGVCYVRYNDGTSTQWVIAAPQIDVTMFVLRTGDTMTGPLVVPGPPTLGGHAANKTYVDTRATVVASDTPPASPIDNTIWLESDTGLLFIRYNDGTSAQWMSVPGVAGDTVRYDAAQTLTALQQTQARVNIAAAPIDALNYSGIQINGSMEISQESGTSTVSLPGATAKYVVDGFVAFNAGATRVGYALQTAISSLPGFFSCIGFACTTPAALAAADAQYIYQPIEGYRWSRLGYGFSSAQPVTIAFWVYCPVAGTMAVSVRNAANNRSYVVDVAVTAANTWQYKTVTIPGCTDGTWPTGNAAAATVSFCFGSGASFQTTPNTWVAANGVATSSTTNFWSAVGTIYLTGVVILPGTEAPSAARSYFITRPYDRELVICKRYLHRIAPGVAMNLGVMQMYSATLGGGAVLSFPVELRGPPTATFSAASHFSAGTVGGGAAACSALALTVSNTQSATVGTSTFASTGGAGGSAATFSLSTVSGWLQFDARL